MHQDAIITAVSEEVQRTLGSAYRVTLIGSRARGRAQSGSDYDFLVEGPEAIPIETLAAMHGRLSELPTLATIDIVDAQTARPEFLAVARA